MKYLIATNSEYFQNKSTVDVIKLWSTAVWRRKMRSWRSLWKLVQLSTRKISISRSRNIKMNKLSCIVWVWTASKPIIFSRINPSIWSWEDRLPCTSLTSSFRPGARGAKRTKKDMTLWKIKMLPDSSKLKTNLTFSTGLVKVLFPPWSLNRSPQWPTLNLRPQQYTNQISKENQPQKLHFFEESQPSENSDVLLQTWRQTTAMNFRWRWRRVLR